jgi:hypothetical protein
MAPSMVGAASSCFFGIEPHDSGRNIKMFQQMPGKKPSRSRQRYRTPPKFFQVDAEQAGLLF